VKARELTTSEVKDALERLADGLMLDPINRTELRAIAIMLMNDADAVAKSRYQPAEGDEEKIQRLGDELVTARMQLADAQAKLEAGTPTKRVRLLEDTCGGLQQMIEEREQQFTRIGVVMGTMRTHFRNAETRRREVMELLAQSRRNAEQGQ
jgi:hypothetical protein